MISGYVRDFLPQLMLILPGLQGPTQVEFILDTAFEGDLALPLSMVTKLNVMGRDPAQLREFRASRRPDGAIPSGPSPELHGASSHAVVFGADRSVDCR